MAQFALAFVSGVEGVESITSFDQYRIDVVVAVRDTAAAPPDNGTFVVVVSTDDTANDINRKIASGAQAAALEQFGMTIPIRNIIVMAGAH